MKKNIGMAMIFLLAAALLAGCGNKENAAGGTSGKKADSVDTSKSAAGDKKLMTGKHHAEIAVKEYGTIFVELDADVAPITVTNFVSLANNGFYEGLTFHRIIEGFMIQGGDPEGNGTGGSDETIKGEFPDNGVENTISHVRGTISMARTSQDTDSASSQFFIMQTDTTDLDGKYAAFGSVTEGMDIVDAICKAVPVIDENGSVDPEEQPVIESITVTD